MSLSAPPDFDDSRLGLDLDWQRILDSARQEGKPYCAYPGYLIALYPEIPDHFRAQDLLLASAISDNTETSFHTTIFEGFDDVCNFLNSIPDPDFLSIFHRELEGLYWTLLQKFSENIFLVSLTDNNKRFIGFEICIYNTETATATSLLVLISPSYQGKKLQHVIFAKTVEKLCSLGIKTLSASTSSDFQHGLEALASKGFCLRNYRYNPGDKSWHADLSYRL